MCVRNLIRTGLSVRRTGECNLASTRYFAFVQKGKKIIRMCASNYYMSTTPPLHNSEIPAHRTLTGGQLSNTNFEKLRYLWLKCDSQF